MENFARLTLLALVSGAAGCGPKAEPHGLDARPSNLTCVAPNRPTSMTGIVLEEVYAGLPDFNSPIFMLQQPGDASRWFVVEQGGRIFSFANDPTVTTTQPVIDISARIVAGGEQGLLGMAFHPDWAQNRRAFLSYTKGGPARNVVSRFRSLDNGVTLSPAPADEELIISVDDPYANHNGGNVAFGPDGYLYVSFGDGGSGGDPGNNGQDKSTLLGDMLRIDVNSQTAPYAIPPTNPYAMGGGRPEIFASGLRNPWRWSFDRATGDLWLGDVGQGIWEEIDIIQAGGNYGWNVREGKHCYNATTCNTAGLIDPIVEYSHADGQSVTGGYVYRGTQIPSLVGSYLYGDFYTGNIWRVAYNDVTGEPSPQMLIPASGANIASFAEGVDGELYVVSYNGKLYKIVASTSVQTENFPQKLSQTGCFNPQNMREVTSGVIPYDIRVPLWSDGAAKQRYMALLDGQKINVGADGDWELPIGSVLIKTFTLGEKRIETRLLVRHSDGDWAGYSYEWDDAQSDATLLPAAKTKGVDTSTWTFPSRADCLRCHTDVAGRSLGLETAQLNFDFIYTSTNRISPQLATLEHIGLFATPLATPAPAFPALDGVAAAADKARAYLHSNCSMCHRPMGSGATDLDLRFSTPFLMAGLCNVDAQKGDLGVMGAKIFAPGDPAKSVMSLRMHTRDANQMPSLATRQVDPQGTQLVDDWIRSLTTCP